MLNIEFTLNNQDDATRAARITAAVAAAWDTHASVVAETATPAEPAARKPRAKRAAEPETAETVSEPAETVSEPAETVSEPEQPTPVEPVAERPAELIIPLAEPAPAEAPSLDRLRETARAAFLRLGSTWFREQLIALGAGKLSELTAEQLTVVNAAAEATP